MIQALIGPIANLAGTWFQNKVEKTKADGLAKVAEAKAELKTIEDTLESRNVAELRAMLKEKGLAVSGKKADLIARLEANMGEDVE